MPIQDREVVEALLPLLTPPPRRDRWVVALDGRSGAGKTRLAGALAEAFTGAGTAAVPVPLEAMYTGWRGLAAALPVACDEVLLPYREGRAVAHRTWDWHADRPGPRVAVPDASSAPVLLLEGVGTSALPCPDLVDVTVWLEAPEPLRKQRALDRDGDTYAPWWDVWAEQEDALFSRCGGPAAADLVVELERDTVRG